MRVMLHIVQTDVFLAAAVKLPGWVRWMSGIGLLVSLLAAGLALAAFGVESAPLLVAALLVGSASALGLWLSKRRSVLTLSADGLALSGPPKGQLRVPLSDLVRFEHVPLQRSLDDGIPHEGNQVDIVVRGDSLDLSPLVFGTGVLDHRLVELTRELNATLERFRRGGA